MRPEPTFPAWSVLYADGLKLRSASVTFPRPLTLEAVLDFATEALGAVLWLTPSDDPDAARRAWVSESVEAA